MGNNSSAIWNEYGKQLNEKMRKKKVMNNIEMALEPETASLSIFN